MKQQKNIIETTKPPLKALPWIGSYFGIPEPENLIPFSVRHKTEIEMHVLLKSLKVRTIVLRYADREQIFCFDEITLHLRNMAYVDDEAIASMVYVFGIDDQSGERVDSGIRMFPVMRTGKTTWKSVIPSDRELSKEFTPSIYKTRHSYTNSLSQIS